MTPCEPSCLNTEHSHLTRTEQIRNNIFGALFFISIFAGLFFFADIAFTSLVLFCVVFGTFAFTVAVYLSVKEWPHG